MRRCSPQTMLKYRDSLRLLAGARAWRDGASQRLLPKNMPTANNP
jgi:heat shock protein HslJ